MDIQAALRSALQHHQAGRLTEAEAMYRSVLQAQPSNPDALHLLGVIANRSGDHAAAVELIEKAMRGQPPNADFLNNLGTALAGLGRTEEAERRLREALNLAPDSARSYANLGNVLKASSKLEEAERCFGQAVRLVPDYAEAHEGRGDVLRQLGRFADAEQSLRKALALRADSAQAHSALGEVLQRLGRASEAEQSFRQALAIRPESAETHNSLGTVLHGLGRVEEAQQCYRTALSLNPAYATAHGNLGHALLYLGNPEEAEKCYRRCLELKPDGVNVHSMLLQTLVYLHGNEAQVLYDEHVEWARRHVRGLRARTHSGGRSGHADGRLRLGYVSPDFRRHSVACFLEPVLGSHDHGRFEIFGYSLLTHEDDVTRRLRGFCDRWRTIAELSDGEAAEQIQADGIDILVDLAGHSGLGRLLIFARKPAPVQFSWLGYASTTGLAAIDYRLTDGIADPAGQADRFYTEKLVRLPRCFLCYGPPSEAPEPECPPLLQSGRVTFGCFNNFSKITRQMIALWSALLAAMPQARIVLKMVRARSSATERRLRDEFERNGVAPERIDVRLPDASFLRHLDAYREIDVALDVFPYNGTTTTCEALWMGVPVVTLAGDTHVSRVGRSILTQLGLTELVAATPGQYVRQALALAGDAPGLCALRSGLRQRMRGSPLLDARGFTRDLETAFATAFESRRSEAVARGSASR